MSLASEILKSTVANKKESIHDPSYDVVEWVEFQVGDYARENVNNYFSRRGYEKKIFKTQVGHSDFNEIPVYCGGNCPDWEGKWTFGLCEKKVIVPFSTSSHPRVLGDLGWEFTAGHKWFEKNFESSVDAKREFEELKKDKFFFIWD